MDMREDGRSLRLAETAREVADRVDRVILGKHAEVREILLAFLANGHVLLEDMPGVGKTTLATAFSRAMGLHCRRVQFTPDVMPSDLTGFSVYRQDTGQFVYQPGSVFCNLLLADELNRTSAKTQSALLEVMEERRVTVEGVTRAAPTPFLVIATQNPEGSAGTQRLPESQTDRFMITLSLGYPDFESELEMAKTVDEGGRADAVQPVVDGAGLLAMQHDVHRVYIHDEVYRYLLRLVTATRESPYLERGAGPRATVALVKMAKSAAWLRGRRYVLPEDVREQFPYTVRHRLRLNADARAEGMSVDRVLQAVTKQVDMPSPGERRT